MTADRRALIVAVDDYADAGLRRLLAPASDAAALAEVLAAPGVGDFTVDVVHNGTAQEIRVSVEDFFADARPDDLLLLHFSGHGLKNAGGELFLAAADSRPDRLASTAVAADFVNRQMAESRAQRIALFLDCCYGGAFPRGMVVRGAGDVQVREAFAETERSSGGRGRVVVTASSAVEYAFEGAELAPGVAARAVGVHGRAGPRAHHRRRRPRRRRVGRPARAVRLRHRGGPSVHPAPDAAPLGVRLRGRAADRPQRAPDDHGAHTRRGAAGGRHAARCPRPGSASRSSCGSCSSDGTSLWRSARGSR